MLYDIPCVILGGGKSSRMGEGVDKALLPFDGFDTMIEYQCNKFLNLFKEVYISTKSNKFDFLKDNPKYEKVKIIYDKEIIFSPLVAINSVFQNLETKKIFLITVDTPLIRKETIKLLIEKSSNYSITVPNDGKFTHNLCGVFNSKIKDIIKNQISKEQHKIALLQALLSDFKTIKVTDTNQFLNINTIQDYNSIYKLS